MDEKITPKMLRTIRHYAKRANYPGTVTVENAKEILTVMAEKYTESLAESFERGYHLAVMGFTGRENDNWELITSNLDSILKLLDINTDYPGLYPTFELDRGGKHFCEYYTLGALRQYNNYWNHW